MQRVQICSSKDYTYVTLDSIHWDKTFLAVLFLMQTDSICQQTSITIVVVTLTHGYSALCWSTYLIVCVQVCLFHIFQIWKMRATIVFHILSRGPSFHCLALYFLSYWLLHNRTKAYQGLWNQIMMLTCKYSSILLLQNPVHDCLG